MTFPTRLTLALSAACFCTPPSSAQTVTHGQELQHPAEFAVATGYLGMSPVGRFGGPAIEARWLQPVTRGISYRVRLGYTLGAGGSDSEQTFPRHIGHGALESYWMLTSRKTPGALYASFGVTGLAYAHKDLGARFFSTPSDTMSKLTTAFCPSAGIGTSVALSKAISLSAEVQGMVNLVYPYEPAFGGLVMIGVGWRL